MFFAFYSFCFRIFFFFVLQSWRIEIAWLIVFLPIRHFLFPWRGQQRMRPLCPSGHATTATSMRSSVVAALSRAASASLSRGALSSLLPLASPSSMVIAPRLVTRPTQHRGFLVVAAAEARAEGRNKVTKKVASEAEAAAAPAAVVRKRRTAKAASTTSSSSSSEIGANEETSSSSSPLLSSEVTPSSLLLPSPMPPPIDLRACLPADPTPFAAVRRWILFSDLHVCDRTVDASVAALAAVRSEARRLQREMMMMANEERGGGGSTSSPVGVAFLGDFWHARGSIPVRPLNAVLDEMAKWEGIPLLMLVGNHDQVTAGGTEHALEAVAAAATAAGAPAHVFDRPAVFLGALWLPYRRDPAELSAAIAAAASEASGTGGASKKRKQPLPPSVVFAHTDVLGAAANDAYQCGKGLDPAAFPARAWLGHFHKPHVVGGSVGDSARASPSATTGATTTNEKNKKKKKLDAAIVEYIGSPYQVSRAEAGQRKALVVLRGLPSSLSSSSSSSSSPASDPPTFADVEIRHDWGEVARVPLDVGPRHFELRGLEPEAPEGLRPGDRLVTRILLFDFFFNFPFFFFHSIFSRFFTSFTHTKKKPSQRPMDLSRRSQPRRRRRPSLSPPLVIGRRRRAPPAPAPYRGEPAPGPRRGRRGTTFRV